LPFKTHIRTMLLVAVIGMASSIHAAEIASATISSTQLDPTDWQYNLTLNDLGTTDIGTFWFSWVPGEDFMGVAPSDVSSPASWTDAVTHGGASDGYAIQWVAGAGDELTPGNSLAGFQFDSTISPAEMEEDSPFYPAMPVLTAFVYSGAPFSDAGLRVVVQPAAAAAPEPDNRALAMLGAGVLVLMLGLQFRRRQRLP
jgi:hypothetical protein